MSQNKLRIINTTVKYDLIWIIVEEDLTVTRIERALELYNLYLVSLLLTKA